METIIAASENADVQINVRVTTGETIPVVSPEQNISIAKLAEKGMRVYRTVTVPNGLLLAKDKLKISGKSINVAYTPIFSSTTGELHHFQIEVFCKSNISANALGILPFTPNNEQFSGLILGLDIHTIYKAISKDMQQGESPANAHPYITALAPEIGYSPQPSIENADSWAAKEVVVETVYGGEIRGTLISCSLTTRTGIPLIRFGNKEGEEHIGILSGLSFVPTNYCAYQHGRLVQGNLTSFVNILFPITSPTKISAGENLDKLVIHFGAQFKLLCRKLNLE